MDSKFIILARAAKEEGNYEDAKKYYEMVKTEDPFNPEAKFYYQYYVTMTCKNGEIVGKYQQLYKCVEPTFKLVKESSMSEEEKAKFVEEVCDIMDKTGDLLWEHLNGLGEGFNHECVQISDDRRYIKCVLDKIVINIFGEVEPYIPILVKLWKNQLNDTKFGFYYQKMTEIYMNLGYDASWADLICEKIKKYDPTYERPASEDPKSCSDTFKELFEKIKNKKNDK